MHFFGLIFEPLEWIVCSTFRRLSLCCCSDDPQVMMSSQTVCAPVNWLNTISNCFSKTFKGRVHTIDELFGLLDYLKSGKCCDDTAILM